MKREKKRAGKDLNEIIEIMDEIDFDSLNEDQKRRYVESLITLILRIIMDYPSQIVEAFIGKIDFEDLDVKDGMKVVEAYFKMCEFLNIYPDEKYEEPKEFEKMKEFVKTYFGK